MTRSFFSSEASDDWMIVDFLDNCTLNWKSQYEETETLESMISLSTSADAETKSCAP